MFALKQASRLRVSLLQCFCLVRAMLLASSATAPMPREGCRDNTPSSVRRSCTHSKHALLSTVPAWLFSLSRPGWQRHAPDRICFLH